MNLDLVRNFIKKIISLKLPSHRQWFNLLKILPSRERWLTRGLLILIAVSIAFIVFNNYIKTTYAIPKIGGQYKEGVLGQPRYINPVLSPTNDADRDLVQLIYSGLFKYDGQSELISDLAESYQIEENNLAYHVFLKKNVLWHDRQPLTSQDVIFTIKTIQDPEFRSPLRNNWQGVEVEAIDDYHLIFRLNNPYAPFLHNLTIGTLPKHLWAGISAANFSLAEYNLKPIGSGPYQFKNFVKNKNGKIESIELTRNPNFYLSGPFIEKITLQFYNTPDAMIDAYKKSQIDGIGYLPIDKIDQLKNNLNIYKISQPSYYAVFFNQSESAVLTDKNVRLSLAYATNKTEIIEQILKDNGTSVNSPILPGWLGYSLEEDKGYDFNLEKAQQILEDAGWKDTDNDGIREKSITLPGKSAQETKLGITLTTTNWPELTNVAQLLKTQWERLGIQIELQIVNATEMQQDYIRPRQYQALLFGEILKADPDPFAFWHSSQKKDPGLNLALYQNKDADKLLEEARQNLDPIERAEKYSQFQKIVTEDIPAVFLYSPTILYPIKKNIKGISLEKFVMPAQRFSQIENWYIKTNRIWR